MPPLLRLLLNALGFSAGSNVLVSISSQDSALSMSVTAQGFQPWPVLRNFEIVRGDHYGR